MLYEIIDLTLSPKYLFTRYVPNPNELRYAHSRNNARCYAERKVIFKPGASSPPMPRIVEIVDPDRLTSVAHHLRNPFKVYLSKSMADSARNIA